MNEKNYKKYLVFLVPVVLLLVVFLFIKPSFSLEDVKKEIYLYSEHANYLDEEHNSWELYKTARWINKNEAEIEIDVKSYPFDASTANYIFMLDMTDIDHIDSLLSFIEEIYDNEEMENTPSVSVILYGSVNEVLLTRETDQNVIIDALEDLQYNYYDRLENVDYYEPLITLENMLKQFETNGENNTKVIFVGKPYEGTTPNNQEEEFDYIKETFPDIDIYFSNMGEISTSGFLNKKADYIGNNIELLTAANVIDKFVITDYIDTKYFEYEEVIENSYKVIAYINCIPKKYLKTTNTKVDEEFLGVADYCDCGEIKLRASTKSLNPAKVKIIPEGIDSYDPCADYYLNYKMDNLEVDKDTGKIIWNLSNSIYSTNATLKLKVKLKDQYLNSEEKLTTNSSTRVESDLDNIEENVYTTDSPELKQIYTVTYSSDVPECYFEPVVEKHSIFSEVTTIDEPTCSGYVFKGWYSIPEIDPEYYSSGASEVMPYEAWLDWMIYQHKKERVYSTYLGDKFIMPDYNMNVRATWGKVGIDKHFEGDEFGSYALYSIEQKSLVNATEIDAPYINKKSTVTNVSLNTLDAIAEYEVTAVNLSDNDYRVEVDSINAGNPNMDYEIVDSSIGLPANSSTKFTIRVKYKEGLTELPTDTNYSLQLFFNFRRDGAMFDTGKVVNRKIKAFVNAYASYYTYDSTITDIKRFTGIPDSSKLVEANLVSIINEKFQEPIYMWYDSENTTIYWYSPSLQVYYNPDSSYFFNNLSAINSISCIDDISSKYVTNMESMFSYTGYSSTAFTLDLGNKFDTSKVTNMINMFYSTGYSSPTFTLDLGDKFDTSKVTTMQDMFNKTGYSSELFTLDLGDKFDTSQVTNMTRMFTYTAYNSQAFTLDLGNKFDTSNVTNMSWMFDHTGYNSPVFTLNLGSKFDTSKVTNMSNMFTGVGQNSTVLTLDLGDMFNTSNVTNMRSMFEQVGYKSPVFTLDLGDKYNTSKVINMDGLFSTTGYSSTVFTLNLGNKFDTTQVSDMSFMFYQTGYNSTSFTLDLGDKFNTGNVIKMDNMFQQTGYSSTIFTLNLGDKFNTSKVTSMFQMFYRVGYSSPVFTLDLGDKFDTSNVTNMASMFSTIGYSNPSFTTLDLGALFNTSKVTNMRNIFNNCKYLKTIYAPSTFVTTSATSYSNMFYDCTNIVGGAGTTYSSNRIDKTYARIDGGPSNPGYFTARN